VDTSYPVSARIRLQGVLLVHFNHLWNGKQVYSCVPGNHRLTGSRRRRNSGQLLWPSSKGQNRSNNRRNRMVTFCQACYFLCNFDFMCKPTHYTLTHSQSQLCLKGREPPRMGEAEPDAAQTFLSPIPHAPQSPGSQVKQEPRSVLDSESVLLGG
jgi:hypothetical protein